MKLTFDSQANAAYLQLREKSGDLETVCVSDELNVDLLPDGSVFGLEFLNAAEQLRAADDGRLIVIDLVSGEEQALQVA